MIWIFINALLHMWWVFAALVAAGILASIHERQSAIFEDWPNDDLMDVAYAVHEGELT